MRALAGWDVDEHGFFMANVISVHGQCHLVVERLPEQGWDWVVWKSERSANCLYGQAETAEEAKRAAESAARMLGNARGVFLVNSALALHRQPVTLN